MSDMSYDDIFAAIDREIADARKKTEIEYIERYELFGFTEHDYKETKALTGDFFVLWSAPKLAKEKGTTPQELVAHVMLGMLRLRE